MKELTVSIYMDWGSPLRIFTGAVEPQAEQDSLDVPFFVSVRDFAVNVGSSTIKRWGSNTMPCPGSVRVNNAILTNKQEPHYHCTAVPFVELRKLTNNTDMHPQNKDRANAIIKWLEPIYKEYAEAILKPVETGTQALSSKFGDTHEQEKSEYRKLRESGMSAPEALTAVLGEPNQRPRFACDSTVPVESTRIFEEKKSENSDIQECTPQTKSITELLGDPNQRPRVACDSTVPVGFTVDAVAKRLYELKKENESLQAEVEKLKKELEDYRTIRDMFLSIGGD